MCTRKIRHKKGFESTFWFSTSEVFQTREHSSLENFYLYAIEAQTNKPGKICYTKNFNLSEITLDMKDKNAIELKENEQSNIHFNYAETTPDHRTAGNLAH